MPKELQEMYDKKRVEIIMHLKQFDNKKEPEILNEHLFCILTPQSNAKTCWEAVELLTKSNNKKEIAEILKGRSRFHNTKANRIIKARENWDKTREILNQDLSSLELRNVLAKNVDGYGLKEAGHFLRNIGKSNNKIAILDRHIVKNLEKFGAFSESPNKIKSNKHYLELEQEALKFANKANIPIDHLDLLFWYMEHGEFFK